MRISQFRVTAPTRCVRRSDHAVLVISHLHRNGGEILLSEVERAPVVSVEAADAFCVQIPLSTDQSRGHGERRGVHVRLVVFGESQAVAGALQILHIVAHLAFGVPGAVVASALPNAILPTIK